MKLATRNSKLKICIDCRFWGLENTGLGRYTMRLVEELMHLDHHNDYYLLLRSDKYHQLLAPSYNLPTNFHLVLADARQYTFKEQFLLTKILYQIKPDLLHVPHFNIPVFWLGKIVVTIHDLIKHSSVGADTTTLPMPIYWLKLLVYRYWVVKQAILRSRTILVPSNFVKNELTTTYSISPSKIHVTYEAPDQIYYQKLNTQTPPDFKKLQTISPYLIYTGNVYPHKNLPNLLEAIKLLNLKLETRNLKLYIVCGRDIFKQRTEKLVDQMQLQEQVKFLGFVPDEILRELYRNSLAFITPSLLEGFGLSGLEAMAAGTPVLSSNASCLPEIYGSAAIYFDPHNPNDIADKIHQILNLKPAQRQSLINQAIKHAQTFSWQKMAQQTLEIYQSI